MYAFITGLIIIFYFLSISSLLYSLYSFYYLTAKAFSFSFCILLCSASLNLSYSFWATVSVSFCRVCDMVIVHICLDPRLCADDLWNLWQRIAGFQRFTTLKPHTCIYCQFSNVVSSRWDLRTLSGFESSWSCGNVGFGTGVGASGSHLPFLHRRPRSPLGRCDSCISITTGV